MNRLRTYSIRVLPIVVTIIAAAVAWFTSEVRYYQRRIAASEALRFELRSTSHEDLPWYVQAGYRWRGMDPPECIGGFLLFDGLSTITDETLGHVACFPKLVQLLLDGEIAITDQGLQQLEVLQQLQELNLADAPVRPEAVECLKRALPTCEIRWRPKRPTVEVADPQAEVE